MMAMARAWPQLAAAVGWQSGDGLAHYVGGVLRVAVEHADDLLDRNAVVIGMPAIVVGDHGDGDVADLGLAGELGFLEIGHADKVKSLGAIGVALGLGGELRDLPCRRKFRRSW